MAQRKQYKSSFKEKGFKPESIGDGGVRRILEEGNRQVSVLKDQFAYEKSQRDNVLAAMKSNATLEKADRDKNFNAETQNRRDIQNRVQANFKTQEENEKRQAEAQAQIYKDLSSLSKTANEEFAKLDQKKFDKDYQDELNKILIEGPDYFKQAEFQTQEDQLMVASAENEVGANALAAAGATPLQAQRVRSNSKGRQYAQDQAQTMFAMQEFVPYAKKFLAENHPDVLDPAEKRVIMQGLLKPYMEEKGIYGLKPEFLTPALMETRKNINEFISVEEDNYTNFLQDQSVEQSTTSFLTSKNMLVDASRLFNDLTVRYGDRSQALDKMFEIAIDLDEDEYEAFINTVMPGQNAPLSVIQEGRVKKLQRERISRQQGNWDRNDKTRKIEAKNFELKALEVLRNDPNLTEAEIKDAQTKYEALSGGLSSQAIKNLESSTIASQSQEALKESLTKLADTGQLTEEMLNSVANAELSNDKTLRAAAKRNSDLYKTPVYKNAETTLKNLVLLQGEAGSVEGKVLTPEADIIYGALVRKFRNRVNELTSDPSNPMSVAKAVNTAQIEAAKDYREGLEDKNSDYYFEKVGDLNNPPGYRNLDRQLATPQTASAVTARTQDIAKRIEAAKGGDIRTVLAQKPGLVFNQPEALAIVSSYYSPGYKTPALVRKLAQQYNLPETEIINAQLKAFPNMPELPPPPSMELLNQVSPETRAGLQNAFSAVQSTRFLSQTGQYNEAAIPKGYGTTVTEAAAQFNIPAPVLAGLIETESSWNPIAISRSGARGLGQFMPGTAAQFGVDVSDPKSSIFGAAQYLRHLMDNYGFDMKTAIYAYNAGPGTVLKYGVGATQENADYYPKVMRGATKYGYGQQSYVESYNLRTSMEPKVAYIAGNIGGGPYYTGEHLDVKQTNRQEFAITDLDDYVEVEDPKYGRVPLSKVGVTGDWESHTNRNSHGIDYGTATGSQIFLKNGATVTYRGDSGDGNGDVMAFTLPDGREFQFLHGTLPQ